MPFSAALIVVSLEYCLRVSSCDRGQSEIAPGNRSVRGEARLGGSKSASIANK